MLYFAHGDEAEHATGGLSHQISDNVLLIAIVSVVTIGILVGIGLWLSRSSDSNPQNEKKSKSDE